MQRDVARFVGAMASFVELDLVGSIRARLFERAAAERDRRRVRRGASLTPTSQTVSLRSRIEHTLLRADATSDDLARLCDEAREHGLGFVCVASSHVSFCRERLRGSGVGVTAVVGFPLGAESTLAKAYEASQAILAGADEIDMVMHLGALEGRDYETVYEDIAAVVDAAREHPVKVIVEAGALERQALIIACALAKAAGAAYVKTSTGFGKGGATVDDVALMRLVVGDDVGVKASGGIKTAAAAEALVRAGANRIGASASIAIVRATNEATDDVAAAGGNDKDPREPTASGARARRPHKQSPRG